MTKEDFIRLAADKFDSINALTQKPNMYEYELGLEELMKEFACSIMEQQLGQGDSSDRRKKKS